MKHLNLFLTLLFLAVVAVSYAAADGPCSDTPPVPIGFDYNNSDCKNVTNFAATPLIDGTVNIHYSNEIATLYGIYGNNESTSGYSEAVQHYNQGITLANQIVPLCTDGSAVGVNGCSANNAKIVFLFIGFSNCDVEICGGHVDAWDALRNGRGESQLLGQACATKCPNVGNPDGTHPWNRAFRGNTWDGYEQMSLLRQVYPLTGPSLVGASVVVFDGALGMQGLDAWDPTSIGYYANNDCPYDRVTSNDPECNYYRVADDLRTNGFTEAQVQAVFFKAADGFPTCDLERVHCLANENSDAYQAEVYLGDILRYLKCCKNVPPGSEIVEAPRYLNLKQVFVTSRIYGGYANNSIGGANACLNPEPFAYELGFGVQRLITAQIRQAAAITTPTDQYSGQMDYTVAPWVDWGPYLWASADTPRNDGLFWCGGQSANSQCNGTYDVIQGNLSDSTEFGDFTHPNGNGVAKVAGRLVNFINQQTGSPWIRPWIGR